MKLASVLKIRVWTWALITILTVGFSPTLPAGELPLVAASTYTPHTPIWIIGNGGFTQANGVISGSGKPLDPYIIEGWSINASSGAGIVVKDVTASFIIRQNRVFSGKLNYGVSLVNVTHAVVSDTVILNSAPAIGVDASSNVTIANNTVTGAADWGIYLYNTTQSLVSGNTVTSTGSYGIDLEYSYNCSVTDNVLNNDYIGIDLLYSNQIIVIGNNLTINSLNGIRLNYSNFNLFYHNNFLSNGQNQAFDQDNQGNAWNDSYPTGGNYWSDYQGVDKCNGPNQNICTGPDGIGDTPYSLPVYAPYIDHYPLVKPYTGLKNPLPDLSLSLNPANLSIPAGSSLKTVITLNSLNNFHSNVSISVTVYDPGLSATLNATTFRLNAQGTASSQLILAASKDAGLGTFEVNVTANTGYFSRVATAIVKVTAAQTQQPIASSGNYETIIIIAATVAVVVVASGVIKAKSSKKL